MRASSRLGCLVAVLLVAGHATPGNPAEAFVPTPDPFHFTDQDGVTRNTQIISDSVTLTGLAGPAPISVAGGKYSIGCGHKFTGADGTIEDGQSVCVRQTSSPEPSTATDTTLTVGGAQDTFTVTTLAGNTVPEGFTFIDVVDALLNTVQVSDAVTVRGIDSAVAVAVTGGEYSIGCNGAFTDAPGSIAAGQTVCVRHTSSAQLGTATHTTLTAGGVADTFTSTTPAPMNLTQTGAPGSGLLLVLLVLLVRALRARSTTTRS